MDDAGIRAERVTFAYAGGPPALRSVSARFAPGRVTAVIGPNGGGKSTLLRVLAGLARPSGGRATLGGVEIATMGAGERARRIAYVPQRPRVAFGYTVRDVLGMGRLGAPDDGLVERAAERLGLAPFAGRIVTELSAGQQQRVAIARAVAQLAGPGGVPRAFLADEPVAALDPRHAVEVLGLLRSLAREGVAVVVVLHDLTSAAGWADDALALSGGEVAAGTGPCAEVLAPGGLERLFDVQFRVAGPTDRPVAIVAGPARE